MSLHDSLIESNIDEIEDDAIFMEEEYNHILDYCIKNDFNLSKEDIKEIKSRGLGNVFEDWMYENMNAKKVRERVLANRKPYEYLDSCMDLISFTVSEEYFTYDCDTDTELEPDFNYIIVVVEKYWLLDYIKNNGIEYPLEYLITAYTWDDSYEWFLKAKELGKVVAIEFIK